MTLRKLEPLLERLRVCGFDYDLSKPHMRYWHFSAWPTISTKPNSPGYIMIRVGSLKVVAEVVKAILMGYDLGQIKASSQN